MYDLDLTVFDLATLLLCWAQALSYVCHKAM